MNTTKNVALLILVICSAVGNSPLNAQEHYGQPYEYLRYGIGAREMALGGNMLGAVGHPNSLYWNPAGLYSLKTVSVSHAYVDLFLDTRLSMTAIAIPLSKIKENCVFGISWVDLVSNGFEGRGKYNEPLGDFKLVQDAFVASFSIPLIFEIQGGISHKWTRTFLGGGQNINFDYSHLWDIGIYKKINLFEVSAVVRHISNDYSTNEIQVAASYRFKAVSVFVQFYELFWDNRNLNTGVELNNLEFKDYSIPLRCGIDVRRKLFNVGFGTYISIKNKKLPWPGKTKIDFAFQFPLFSDSALPGSMMWWTVSLN
ncbi:hypothetical protein KAR48_16170 [bacterium]|nr:hypothetical protein [bacterium]